MIFLTKNSKRKPSEPKEQKAAVGEENFMSLGISLGMCFGVAVGSALMNTFGAQALTYGICFGMLAGLTIGVNIKKK